jgi:hypothetical protein
VGLVLSVLVLGVVVVGWFYGDTIRWRISLVRAQRRAASGVLRPDQVVFEEDPTRAAVLLRNPAYKPAGKGALKHAALIVTPPALANYPAGRLVGQVGLSQAPLFVGRRDDDQGNGAIVYAYAGLGLTPGAQVELPISYWCDPLAPLSWNPPGRSSGGAIELGSMVLDEDLRRRDLHRTLTLFAGVPDPKDARRFTVYYEIDGSPGTIEFVFRRVGIMDVKVLDGPLSPLRLKQFAR